MKPAKTKPATLNHELLYKDLCRVAGEYEKEGMPPEEILAIVSKLVGRLIACQDPFKFTRDTVMKILTTNLEKGNEEMMTELLKNKQS